MTLLTIIQDAAIEVGLTAPSSVVGNTDSGITQMLAMSNRGGKALAKRTAWQELTREWSFTTIATESQGLVDSIMPGFNWDVYNTIWNRSTRFEIAGPLYPDEWQFLKAMGINGPYPQFRIRGKRLLMMPVPTGGQSLYGEYVSKYWCESTTCNGQDRWVADTDTGVLNEDLLTLDLIWRYKRAKGFDYAEEMREAEIQINQAMSVNGSNRIVDMGESENYLPGGLFIPPGNWS